MTGGKFAWRPCLAAVGVLLDLFLSAILLAFLPFDAELSTDAVPRPVVIAALFTSPAIIASFGILNGAGRWWPRRLFRWCRDRSCHGPSSRSRSSSSR